MFNRIVVPLDGTHFAAAALAPARELARAFNSRILVTRAVPPAGWPMSAVEWDEAAERDRLDAANESLHAAVESLRAQGYKADLLLRIAEPGAAIAKAAELDYADVIVMATHLRWKVNPTGGRSVTLQVLARSQTPIFAWRVSGAVEVDGGQDVTQRPTVLARVECPIVVPLDGSPFAEQALEAAVTLARAFGLYLVLVRAIEPIAMAGEEADVALYLDRVCADLERRGVRAVTTVRRGTALGVIDRVWREYDGGLIVIASHGRGGLTGTFLGSVAAHLLEEVEAPVLVIRPRGGSGDASCVTTPTILYHEYRGQPR